MKGKGSGGLAGGLAGALAGGVAGALSGWRLRRDGGEPDAGGVAARLARQSLHEQHISALFPGGTRFAGKGPVLDCALLLVAFTNRSGSNLLCEYLAQTGQVAVAGECLNHDTVAVQQAQHGGTRFTDHIAWLAAQFCPAGATAARTLAFKASLDQMVMLLRWNIPAMFPAVHVLHVRRCDALAQAVSLSVASQTGRWTSQQAGRSVTPDWRPQEVGMILAGLRLEMQGIGILADVAGLPLAEVTYEDMIADPAGQVGAALRFCGIDPGGWTPDAPAIDQQTDADKSALLERARAAMLQALLDHTDRPTAP